MPPKKAEPEPVVEEAEPELPKISAEEALAKALGMKLNPDPNMEVLMDRSASIQFDPKMKEITGTLTTHASQAPNVTLARARRSETLRTGGCGLVDRRMKEIEHGFPAPLMDDRPGLGQLQSSLDVMSRPNSPVANEVKERHRIPIDEEDALKEATMQRFAKYSTDSSKGRYRDYTDKTMKRLLIDMDFAMDQRQKHYSHQTRCDHLDKSHDWYKHYTLKEEKKKTAPAPPYLRFSNEGPVSPGSMRVQFRQTSPLLSAGRLGKSVSSPSLFVTTGSATVLLTA